MMKFTIVIGLLIVLMSCSVNRETSKRALQIEHGPSHHLGVKSGLLFDHGGYRGTEYTDSLGTHYNLRYNPVTITNDSTIAIQVEISFSKEYDYPIGHGDEQFKVFPLPKEWAQDPTTDSMFDCMWLEFENHMDRPLLSQTIEPGERFVFAIGTLYPLPPENWWVVPNELFAHSDGNTFLSCDWHMNNDPSSIPIAGVGYHNGTEIILGLKLHLEGGCKIIRCGQISFPEL